MHVPAVSPKPRDFRCLTTGRFDALIIGGGITGAGIARDLALRGAVVALVEQDDFASGTSSRSTKPIHGGLRYLERFDLRLVFESCRERHTLQRIAPHLVRPLPLMIPLYRGAHPSRSLVHAGMLLYDLLALGRNTRPHRMLSADEARRRQPLLDPKGLTRAALDRDCRMDDARLCLENVIAAREAGAVTVNYARITALLRRGVRIDGAVVEDARNRRVRRGRGPGRGQRQRPLARPGGALTATGPRGCGRPAVRTCWCRAWPAAAGALSQYRPGRPDVLYHPLG